MEQLQVIQCFLLTVPQGRNMVEEVSQGLGAEAVEEAFTPPLVGSLSSLTPPTLLASHSHSLSFLSPIIFPCLPWPLAPGGQSHHCLCRVARPEGSSCGKPEEAGGHPAGEPSPGEAP